jgi:hypothetical protein
MNSKKFYRFLPEVRQGAVRMIHEQRRELANRNNSMSKATVTTQEAGDEIGKPEGWQAANLWEFV